MTENVLIAGAGIGGLTAALALHARGVDVAVIERTDLRPLGVGINLLPHAVRELYELGLGDELSRIAVAPAAVSYYGPDGTLLLREPRGIDGGYGHPQYSVHRGRLQMLLLSALRDRLGVNAVRDNTDVSGFVDTGADVRVQTSGGVISAGFLIGADGIHSSVRSQLHPGSDPLLVGDSDFPRRGGRRDVPRRPHHVNRQGRQRCRSRRVSDRRGSDQLGGNAAGGATRTACRRRQMESAR